MSEEQVVENEDQEPVIDLDALQASIDGIDEPDEQELDAEQEDEVIEEPEFDLDQALDSDEPIVLEGKITEEEALAKAKERGYREDGTDKFGHKISAIEFLERAPLFHKMSLLRGDIDELKRSNKQLAEHTKKIAQKAIEDQKKQAEAFKAEKERLLSEEVLDKDDIQRLKTLDQKIEETSVIEDDTSAQNEEIVARYEEAKETFMDENKEWYREDYKMTELADKTGTKFAEDYMNEHGVLPEPEVTFKHVLGVVKEKYPDMGKPKRQTRVTTRQNRTVANKPSNKKTLADLPEDQQPIAKMVMEAAGMSEEEYLKNYEF